GSLPGSFPEAGGRGTGKEALFPGIPPVLKEHLIPPAKAPPKIHGMPPYPSRSQESALSPPDTVPPLFQRQGNNPAPGLPGNLPGNIHAATGRNRPPIGKSPGSAPV